VTAPLGGRPTTAVVLAAGKGTRMNHPLLPKPLVPVGGRPMLDRALRGLAASGFTRVVLVVGHRREMLRDRYGDRFTDDAGRSLAVDHVVQETLDGTAAAVTCTAPLLDGVTSFLLTWCDILVEPRWYDELAATWATRTGGGEADLVALTTVVDGNPSVGAAVGFDDDLRMTSFVEKPPGVTHGWADGGVAVHTSTSLAAMADVAPSPRGEKEVADAIGDLLRAGRRVGVARYDGCWADLGSPDLLAAAEERFGDLLD
jgi:glucose-1-phosphate thymidylyltransferase